MCKLVRNMWEICGNCVNKIRKTCAGGPEIRKICGTYTEHMRNAGQIRKTCEYMSNICGTHTTCWKTCELIESLKIALPRTSESLEVWRFQSLEVGIFVGVKVWKFEVWKFGFFVFEICLQFFQTSQLFQTSNV
jgi:hypothetical protein